MTMKTTAERAAEALGDIGTRWVTDSGEGFEALMHRHGGWHERRYEPPMDRYEFPDGSAIVACEGFWDLEGPEPWSFSTQAQA